MRAAVKACVRAVAGLAVAKALADRDAARACTEAAAATVHRLEVCLAKNTLAAPFDALVVARHAQPGEIVVAGSRVVTLVDLSRTWIVAEVDEFDAARVREGDSVVVTAEGLDGKSWRARVEEVPAVLVARRVGPEDPGRPIDARVLLAKCFLLETTPLKLGQRVEVLVASGSR
jgi:multidrug resistance efflux pump